MRQKNSMLKRVRVEIQQKPRQATRAARRSSTSPAYGPGKPRARGTSTILLLGNCVLPSFSASVHVPSLSITSPQHTASRLMQIPHQPHRRPPSADTCAPSASHLGHLQCSISAAPANFNGSSIYAICQHKPAVIESPDPAHCLTSAHEERPIMSEACITAHRSTPASCAWQLQTRSRLAKVASQTGSIPGGTLEFACLREAARKQNGSTALDARSTRLCRLT